MIWLAYYILASWCVALLLAISSWKEFEAISQTELQANPRLVIPAFVLTGPLWMPYLFLCGFGCVGELAHGFFQIWQACRFRKTYHEYTLRPANFFQLPQEVRDWWDESLPKFFRLGFSLLGDFQLRDNPYQMHDRFYWHESGTAYCSACALTLAGIHDLTFAMTSWLEDGTYVITATVDVQLKRTKPNPRDDKLHIACLPGATAEELFARHRQEVVATAREFGLRVLNFDQEQFEALVIYDQRVFCGWLHRNGAVTAPPAPVLPPSRGVIGLDKFLAATASGNA
jgi:hypothetical protein